MSIVDFQESLRKTGGYSTPPDKQRPFLPRFIASPIFHLYVGLIFFAGYRMARDPDFETKKWSQFCYLFHRLTERLGGRIHVSGFDQLAPDAFPVVWVSNHVSSLETYLLPETLTIYSRLLIVLKESLAHYPCFGRVVRSLDPIRINRQNAREDLRKVLTDGQAGLAAGRSVLIFPQGQRTPQFDPAGFNSLGIKLAQRAKVPIVPLAVRTDYLGLGRLVKELGPVQPRRPVCIACGPLLPPEMDAREQQRACTDFISGKLCQWEQEDGGTLLANSIV